MKAVQAKSAERHGAAGHVVAFEYPGSADAPALGAWIGWDAPEESAAPASAPAHFAREAELRAEFELKLAEEMRRAFEAGRERGRQEGRQAEREAQAAGEEQRRRQTAGLVQSFAEERDRYLQSIEREVVQLALAVAARILRREAQMDPLLLTGAVRVALGQLSATTEVRLRVPPAELDLWAQSIAHLPNLPVKPAVVSGDGMRLGDCVIETAHGSVDLGIRAQLGEIERGFFDRAQGRAPQLIEAQAPAAPARGQP
jgi:flagellar assembly protein FliH